MRYSEVSEVENKKAKTYHEKEAPKGSEKVKIIFSSSFLPSFFTCSGPQREPMRTRSPFHHCKRGHRIPYDWIVNRFWYNSEKRFNNSLCSSSERDNQKGYGISVWKHCLSPIIIRRPDKGENAPPSFLVVYF
jgi:hypothetical protein